MGCDYQLRPDRAHDVTHPRLRPSLGGQLAELLQGRDPDDRAVLHHREALDMVRPELFDQVRHASVGGDRHDIAIHHLADRDRAERRPERHLARARLRRSAQEQPDEDEPDTPEGRAAEDLEHAEADEQVGHGHADPAGLRRGARQRAVPVPEGCP